MKSVLKTVSALLAIWLGFALWNVSNREDPLMPSTLLLQQATDRAPLATEPVRLTAIPTQTQVAPVSTVTLEPTAFVTVLYRSGVKTASGNLSISAIETTVTVIPTETSSREPSPTPTREPTPVKPTPTLKPEPTETPVLVLLEDKKRLARYVRPTKTPYLTPTAIEPVLVGKIGFRSDMFGRTKRVYVVEPDGSGLSLLTNPWAYDLAIERERLSPDGRFQVFQAEGRNGLDLFLHQTEGGDASQLTFVGRDEAYDPAWSPDGRRIVFASNQEGDDDIFVVHIGSPQHPRPRTEKLTRDEGWESDKHPSYSPDGSQIVYYSNRTGREQIWLMNDDGSSPRQLLEIDADCWDPVWFWSAKP